MTETFNRLVFVPTSVKRTGHLRINTYQGGYMVQRVTGSMVKNVRNWTDLDAAKRYINQKEGQQTKFIIVNEPFDYDN